MHLRPATEGDLAAIGCIQNASPEASHWNPIDYLAYDCVVAIDDSGAVAGFLVSRALADEREILNVGVHPDFRRRGVGRELVHFERSRPAAAWFLEVRESNLAAINLYLSMGFTTAGRRPDYYENPPEGAIVMALHS